MFHRKITFPCPEVFDWSLIHIPSPSIFRPACHAPTVCLFAYLTRFSRQISHSLHGYFITLRRCSFTPNQEVFCRPCPLFKVLAILTRDESLTSCDDSAISDEDKVGTYSAGAFNADLLMEATIVFTKMLFLFAPLRSSFSFRDSVRSKHSSQK